MKYVFTPLKLFEFFFFGMHIQSDLQTHIHQFQVCTIKAEAQGLEISFLGPGVEALSDVLGDQDSLQLNMVPSRNVIFVLMVQHDATHIERRW